MFSCDVKCSDAGVGGRGLKLDEGLHKSTECLASLSPDSTWAPASLDRATSQPNLLALISQDPVSSSSHRSKSPSRHRAAKLSTEDGAQTSKDTDTFTGQLPVESGSDSLGKSPSRRRPAKVNKEDGKDLETTRTEDAATDKLAVIDRTLAKVMYGLKTLDAIDQNTDDPESVGGTEISKAEEGQKSTTTISETVPIVVKTSSAREDRQDDVSLFASFSRGKKKAATLPKDGSTETIGVDVDGQTTDSDSTRLNTSVEGQHPSLGPHLSRSDSAPQRKEGLGSASFSSTIGHSRFEASSRAVPAATPVVPSRAPAVTTVVPSGVPAATQVVPSGAPAVPSGAPAVAPKPSTARKPGSVKPSRPSADGKTGGADGKLGKK